MNAHRLMCVFVNGDCPPDKNEAAHSCGNRKCVNPAHLRWATYEENGADKIIHGTNRGWKHPTEKSLVRPPQMDEAL